MLAPRHASGEKFPFSQLARKTKRAPKGPLCSLGREVYLLCVEALSCADWDSGSSAAALEPPAELAPGQEQALAEGEEDEEDEEDVLLSVWLWPVAVLSGQVQLALESEMLGEEAPELLPVLLGLALTFLSVVDCANAEPNAPITAAAVMLTASCLTLMCSSPVVVG
jgi:hypothetical protein